MTKIFKFSILLSLLSAFIFLYSCQKEELEPTPFWKQLQGDWQIQKNYIINGQNFEMTDIEATTVLSLFENVTDDDIEILYSSGNYSHKIGFYEERFFLDNRFESIKVDLRFKNRENLNVMIFRNSEGIYTEYDCYRPERFSNYVSDFFRVFTSQGYQPNIYKIGTFPDWKYERFENYSNCDYGPRGVYKHWGYRTSTMTLATIVNGSTENFKLTDINSQISYWSPGDYDSPGINQAFKIEIINSSEIRVVYFTHYYQRKRNGENLYDTIEFRFKKLNTSSSIITIQYQ